LAKRQKDPKPLLETTNKRVKNASSSSSVKKQKKSHPVIQPSIISSSSEQEDASLPDDDDELLPDELPDEFPLNESSSPKNLDFLSSDSDDSELEIEKDARIADEQAKIDQELADQEFKTNIEQRETFVLPSGQEIEQEGIVPEDISLVQTRISECIRILSNFKELKQEGR
jgi:ribosomal RNA methyltransferase Nop2